MQTIEQIRLANYRRLIKELGDERGYELKDPEIAVALGISKVYVWQLRKKERDNIDSKAARKIEAKSGRPLGWLDTDFNLWPFPGIKPTRYAMLTEKQKIKIEAIVEFKMSEFEADLANEHAA